MKFIDHFEKLITKVKVGLEDKIKHLVDAGVEVGHGIEVGLRTEAKQGSL